MARRRLPKVLRAGEADRLAGAAATERDRMIILCGLYLGLRVSEICKLRAEEVDLDDGTVLVAHGKGDKDRYVPIPSRLLEPLRGWLAGRSTGFVFPSPRGSRLSTRAVQYMIAKTRRAADIARAVSPHTLRHTYATQLLTRGANLREVQELLGHSSVATTEIYTHVAVDRLRSTVDRL